MFFDVTGYVNTAILLHIRASTDNDFLKKLTKKLTSKLFIFDSLRKKFTKNNFSKSIDNTKNNASIWM